MPNPAPFEIPPEMLAFADAVLSRQSLHSTSSWMLRSQQ